MLHLLGVQLIYGILPSEHKELIPSWSLKRQNLSSSQLFSQFLIILVITLGLTSLIMTMVLFLPMVFNLASCTESTFPLHCHGRRFSIFPLRRDINYKIRYFGRYVWSIHYFIASRHSQKGGSTEAFLWTAWVLWLFAFLFVWWVRWWEILERRETKKAAKKKADDDKKKADDEKKKQQALKDKPMKAEDAVLQQMAAAQM